MAPASAWARVGDGAAPPLPPPPPIPAPGLILDLESRNYTVTDDGGASHGDWLDASLVGNDFSTGGTLLAHVPAIVPAAFNGLPGVQWDRANSFDLFTDPGPTWVDGDNPLTMVFVVKGTNIQPGCFMHVRGATVASYNFQMSNTTLPQKMILANGGAVLNTSPFFDLTGSRAILYYELAGGVAGPVTLAVNNVPATPDVGMYPRGITSRLFLGYDGGVYFPDSQRLDVIMGAAIAYNRILNAGEKTTLIGNLTQRYL